MNTNKYRDNLLYALALLGIKSASGGLSHEKRFELIQAALNIELYNARRNSFLSLDHFLYWNNKP